MKKLIHLTPFCLAALLATGCAGTRPISDSVLGGGGAVLGGELTHGNPAGIVAGGAGGVLLSEGMHYAAKSQADKAYQTGYEKGRSDAVKQQYWLYVGLQHTRKQDQNVRFYELHLPEQTVDGVIFKPATKLLRIEE